MRSGQQLTIAALFALTAVSGGAGAVAPGPDAPSAPSGGVFFVVRSTSDAVSIRRAFSARKPIVTAKPYLTAAGWEQNPPGSEELIVTLHDKKGNLLGEYGFPTRRIAFADSLGGAEKTLTGGPRALASVELPVHVPSPSKAVFLLLWRVVIRPDDPTASTTTRALSFKIPGNGPYGSVALTVDPLGGFPLTAPLPKIKKFAVPPLPLPPKHPIKTLRFIPGVEVIDLLKDRPLFEVGGAPDGTQPPPPPQPPPCPSNAAPSQNIGSGTPPGSSFNIVILGDGYQAAQMAAFQLDAAKTFQALLRVSPFSDFAAGINAFRVDTPSTDSGVDYCPKECRKQVCYQGTKDGHACSTDTACPGGSCDWSQTCLLGPNDLSACSWDIDCPGGGMCDPPGLCDTGSKAGYPCRSDANCAGHHCIRIEKVCHLGPKAGIACTTTTECLPGTCQSASGCPISDPDPKATALEVSGDLSKLGVCTEFKPDDPSKLSAATCSVLAPADVDLTIVLVNSDAYGGMTYATSKTIFVSARHAPEIIAHEAGHAIANLGEEYIAGIVPCPTTTCGGVCRWPITFDNVALPAEVQLKQVRWFTLTTAAERANGWFTTIQGSNQICTPYVYPDRPWLPGAPQALGLYWGAQYVDDLPDPVSTASPCLPCRAPVNGDCLTLCHSSCDQRGSRYYRPMPRCMMRSVNEPFCRVCYCALRTVLSAKTGLVVPASQCQTTP